MNAHVNPYNDFKHLKAIFKMERKYENEKWKMKNIPSKLWQNCDENLTSVDFMAFCSHEMFIVIIHTPYWYMSFPI